MKLAKYEFKDQATAEAKIKGLGVDTDEDGNEYPTHSHAIVKLGHIVLEQGQYDEEGNEIKAPVLSDKFHVDVLWESKVEERWNTYEIEVEGYGVHKFL